MSLLLASKTGRVLNPFVPPIIDPPPVTSSGVRGPDGSRTPPYTVPYATAATATATNDTTLKAALAAALPNDVIELHYSPSAALTLTAPNLNAPTNITIRPELTTRRSTNQVILNGPITWAGTDFSLPGNSAAVAIRGKHATFWRVVDDTDDAAGVGTQWQIDRGADQAAMVECVAPWWNYNVSGASQDRCHHSSSTTYGPLRRPLMWGCYMAGKVRGCTGVKVAESGKLSPVYSFTDAAALGTGTLGTYTHSGADYVVGAILATLGTAPTSGGPVILDFRKNGTSIVLPSGVGTSTNPMSLNATADQVFGQIEKVTATSLFTLTAGDVLTVVRLDSATGPLDLNVYVGQQSTAHSDATHWISTSTGIRDAQVIDCILGYGSSQVFQFSDMQGEWRIENNWIGSGGIRLGHAGSSLADMRQYVYKNYFYAAPQAGSAGTMKLCMNNVSPGWNAGYDLTPVSPLTADASNTIGTQQKVPALADLTTAWPECPWSP